MTEQEFKYAYARALLLRMDGNEFAVAMEFTRDTGQALLIVDHFRNDPEIKAIQRQLIEEEGEEAFLPSKSQICRDIYARAQHTPDNDEAVKLWKLAADMRGHIEKEGTTINTGNVTTNKIMVLPMPAMNDNGTVNADDWEQRAIAQQERLTAS